MAEPPPIHDLALMTSPEVAAALPQIGAVLIPVGSCEQHGPNIALSSDAGQAAAYARRLAERMHPAVAVAPTISYGLSEHHMHFPGSATLTAPTFIALCTEVATAFARHGFGRFVFMNGHGGNRAALTVVCDVLRQQHGLLSALVNSGELGALEQAEKIFQGRDAGHACEFEVSNALHLCPELVRESTLKAGDLVPNTVRHTRALGAPIHRSYYWEERTRNGVLGDAPSGASADAGREMTERGLSVVCEFLEDFNVLPVPAHRESTD